MTIVLTVVDAVGLLAALFLAVLLVQHLRLLLSHRRISEGLLAAPPPLLGLEAAPTMLVQIPIFNEPDSVVGAIEAAAALEWPRDRLTIQILDDSSDETTALAAAAIGRAKQRGITIEHVRRADRTGFKAGALAAGLARSQATLVAILDADFRSPPDWLRRIASLFERDPLLAFAQSRFEFANREQNFMTRAQQLLVDAHFLVEQAGRLALGEPFQFNGTAGIWRRRAIDDAGGWAADTLAEDLDLAIRAFARGWHAQLALWPGVLCEAPADGASWRTQQQRWSTGFVQVGAKSLLTIAYAPWLLGAKIATALMLGVQLAFPAVLVAITAFALDLSIRGPGFGHLLTAAGVLALIAMSAVAITWPAYQRLRRGGVIRYATTLAALPALFLYLAAANSASILAAPFADGREFVRTPKSGA
jgi:cellulose synthase/poly-beta-1,6-N-acetylglucosamine synthase-like glycosyltransferase